MLRKLRELLRESPRLGWLFAAMLLIVVVFLVVQTRAKPGQYSYERMAQDIRIRCSETGEEWTMPRGRLEADLLARAGKLDASVGVTNPKTGRPTGFPINEWQETIDRLNREKDKLTAGRRGAPSGSGG